MWSISELFFFFLIVHSLIGITILRGEFNNSASWSLNLSLRLQKINWERKREGKGEVISECVQCYENRVRVETAIRAVGGLLGVGRSSGQGRPCTSPRACQTWLPFLQSQAIISKKLEYVSSSIILEYLSLRYVVHAIRRLRCVYE